MVPVYLFVDNTTNSRLELVRRYLKLRLHITVNMNAWSETKRVMQRDDVFDKFLSQRMLAMDRAMTEHPDVCCIDVDVLFLGPLLVDKSRDLGVSGDCRIDGFGSGLLWTKNKALPQRWVALQHESSERSVNKYITINNIMIPLFKKNVLFRSNLKITNSNYFLLVWSSCCVFSTPFRTCR